MTVNGTAESLASSVQQQFASALLVQSDPVSSNAVQVRGPNFDLPVELQSLLASYETIGFQATAFGQAVNIINHMRKWRLSDDPILPDEADYYHDAELRTRTRCTILLGYTSNLVSSGLRDIIRFLVQHNYVSGIVTTAGGIEEDLIKCLGPTYLAPDGRFDLDGATLRKKGLNRIGNLIVPNDNYCKFEDWVTPILNQMVQEQEASGRVWSPSTMIDRLGKEIKDESSILFWAHTNDIPVFCPALTDGSLGDMIFAHTYKSDVQLVIDIVSDIRRLNSMSMTAKKAGMIILGGGVCKHQIANSMLYRNGADFAVYVNTGQEFDGSDTGARPDEAVSWGKIRAGAESVKICADATLVFPLLVAATWGRDHHHPEKMAL